MFTSYPLTAPENGTFSVVPELTPRSKSTVLTEKSEQSPPYINVFVKGQQIMEPARQASRSPVQPCPKLPLLGPCRPSNLTGHFLEAQREFSNSSSSAQVRDWSFLLAWAGALWLFSPMLRRRPPAESLSFMYANHCLCGESCTIHPFPSACGMPDVFPRIGLQVSITGSCSVLERS